MKKYKVLMISSFVISILLLCIMCSFVSYKYCDMTYAIKYKGASAPAEIAFLYVIPFIVAIIITSFLTYYFYKKSKTNIK
ncbi:MAG: hypothetical protein IJX17_08110 [Clostridia bacterium]|nr:hypothetical protein [Clostridia bacterium]